MPSHCDCSSNCKTTYETKKIVVNNKEYGAIKKALYELRKQEQKEDKLNELEKKINELGDNIKQGKKNIKQSQRRYSILTKDYKNE